MATMITSARKRPEWPGIASQRFRRGHENRSVRFFLGRPRNRIPGRWTGCIDTIGHADRFLEDPAKRKRVRVSISGASTLVSNAGGMIFDSRATSKRQYKAMRYDKKLRFAAVGSAAKVLRWSNILCSNLLCPRSIVTVPRRFCRCMPDLTAQENRCG